MSALASAQLQTFWGAVCLGMAMAAAYAVPAAARQAFSLNRLTVSVLDLVYFFLAGLLSFLYLLSTVDGQLRWFVLAGEILGAMLCRLTVYGVLLAMLRWPLKLLARLLNLPLRLLRRCWNRVVKWLAVPENPSEPGGIFSEESGKSP